MEEKKLLVIAVESSVKEKGSRKIYGGKKHPHS